MSHRFSTQTSVHPSTSLERLSHIECGYVFSNSGPAPSTSDDGYLMPDTVKKKKADTTLAVDNDGYLLATSPALPNGKSDDGKSFEHWPMLHAKDNGNVLSVLHNGVDGNRLTEDPLMV